MAKWNKVILSGSRAELSQLTASAAAPIHLPNIGTNASTKVLVIDNVTKQVYQSSYDVGTSTLALTDKYIYVGQGATAVGVQLTGDATMETNAGELRLSGSVISGRALDTTIAGTEEMLMLDGTTLKRTTINAVKGFSSTGSFTGSFIGEFTGSIRQPLTSAQIFVGNGSNIAAPVAMSGDITINNSGVTAIGSQKVLTTMLDASIVSNTTAHDSTPLDLSQTKFFVASGSTGLNRSLTYSTFVNDLRGRISTGSFTGSFTGSIDQPLPSAQIFVGSVTGRAAAVAMSGDIVINNSGVTSFNGRVVTEADLVTDFVGSFASYTTPTTLANTTVFAIGAGGTNQKLTYPQLTGSLSASFAAMNLFGGDKVAGPNTSINNEIAIFDSTTGKIIKQSAAFVTPTGVLSGSALNTSGGATIGTSLQVNGNTTLGDAGADTVTVNGTTTFVGPTLTTTLQGSGSINGDLTVGGKLNVTGNTVITGDLFVNGTTTQINTDNLQVEDRFILLNSGSIAADTGFIFQQGIGASTGIGLGYYQSTDRFAIKKSLSNTANDFGGAPSTYLALVESAASAPSAAPLVGGTNGLGTIHIDTAGNGDFWIYM